MKILPKLSPTSYAMLGLLARNPQSAYELNSRMQTSLLRAFWPRADSHVYSEPKKLLAHQMVTERREKVSGRNRTVFTITSQGREALQAWLQSDSNHELRTQSEFVLKLILADGGKLTDARATLEKSLESTQQDIKDAIEGIVLILDNSEYAAEGAPFNGIVINLMADILIARQQWGQAALETASRIRADASDTHKQATGRELYVEALRKLELAKANVD